MKNIIKVCLALSIISVFVLSCTSKTSDKDKKSTLSPGTNLNENASENSTPSTSSTVIPDDGSPKDTIAAFKDVLKVLHASYEAGDCFFKLKFTTPSTANKEAKIVKQGSASTVTDAAGVGEGASEGQGTYTITATGAPRTASSIPVTVTYEYKDYQPKGSHIIINGKIETERHSSTAAWLMLKKKKYSLNITGLYEAELIFDASKNSGARILRDLTPGVANAGLCARDTDVLDSFTTRNAIKLTFTYKEGTPLTLLKSRTDDTTLLKSLLKLPAAVVAK